MDQQSQETPEQAAILAARDAGSRVPIDAATLEWAMKNFDPVEAAASLKEIRETGGCQLDDFIHELEAIARE